MLIQWFPGHMAKTKRMIAEHLKAVDAVVELLDARIPSSSANPMADELIGAKPRIVILNKSDLADASETDKWVRYYERKGIRTLPVNAADKKDRKKVLQALREAAAPISEKWRKRGLGSRSLRIMIVGIPNVGKSTLINLLSGTAATRTANTPGHTRGKQWVRLADGVDLLDTPGILWPKFEDQTAALRLAATGAVAGEVFDRDEVTFELLRVLAEQAPQALQEKYGAEDLTADPQIILEAAARRRGCILPGGGVDYARAETAVLTDFRGGKLGRITLDEAPSEVI